uniref:shikimate dehydrogenase (NADP(+)) n=1 Tax=Paulinella micropora TaxID=1928728 RepID=A0A385I085_9EUKA|nr:shikimate/quinate 5-dehydrogenase [Paulinella micropora]AXY63337.1 shikimate/quinate 5-dehydrogenase [Paulinella micropora]
MVVFSSIPTKLVGIIGNPLSHSLSPIMQNAAFASLKLNWLYVALPVTNTSLRHLIRDLSHIDCQGINVTIPHKQNVIQHIAELTPIARQAGAVNTLIKALNGNWIGTNTDVEGFMTPLKTRNINWKTKKAIILGCGGSARAVVTALTRLEFCNIIIAGRNIISLQKFVDTCKEMSPQLEYILWNNDSTHTLETAGFQQVLKEADLIINSTPIGMTKKYDSLKNFKTPLTDLQIDMLKDKAIIYDLIYTPRPTPLLIKAASRGHDCIDGLEMLVQQGAASLRLWTGIQDVPVQVMRNAALSSLCN